MKKSFSQLIFITSLFSLILFIGCKNNSGPDLDEGKIRVITITQGENTDGYEIQIRGEQKSQIAANDTLISESLNFGTYKVELLELPEKCAVHGLNPITVKLEDAEEITVTFEVNCDDPPTEAGSLGVITNTSPGNSNYSYLLVLNETEEYDIAANDTLIFNNIEFGSYNLELQEVPDNCTVDGENPRSVQIENEEKVTVMFDVTCNFTGSLEVITTTSIINSEEIYSFNFKDEQFEIGANDTVLIEGIDAGDYQLELFDLPSTCTIKNKNPQAVTITTNSTSSKKFGIFCQTFTDEKLVYQNAKIYNSKSIRFLYPNGKTEIVSPDFENISQISVSPDKSTIAFTANPFSEKAQLYIVNVNGMNFKQLTYSSDFPRVGGFSWSPDSDEIVFSTNNGEVSEIFVLNTNGSDFNLIATKNSEEFIFFTPQWSPSGDKFVFTGKTENSYHIYIMDSDGSNLMQITNVDERRYINPLWSPASNKILFTGVQGNNNLVDIYVYDLISTETINLTENQDDKHLNPEWSPDGSKIIYEKEFSVPNKEDGVNIFIMNSDGSNVKQLTHTGAGVYNRLPSWSPDGEKIAFNRFAWYGNPGWEPDATHIFVMKPDGSEKNDIGSDGCCVEWIPLE